MRKSRFFHQATYSTAEANRILHSVIPREFFLPLPE